eukprot:6212717-Pleurochrysis_carterae.AAC.4
MPVGTLLTATSSSAAKHCKVTCIWNLYSVCLLYSVRLASRLLVSPSTCMPCTSVCPACIQQALGVYLASTQFVSS